MCSAIQLRIYRVPKCVLVDMLTARCSEIYGLQHWPHETNQPPPSSLRGLRITTYNAIHAYGLQAAMVHGPQTPNTLRRTVYKLYRSIMPVIVQL